jgi:hypothetical protein
LLITDVNGEPAARSAIAPFLAEAGFVATSLGYQKRAVVHAERSEASTKARR